MTRFTFIINLPNEKLSHLINKKRRILIMEDFNLKQKESFTVLGIGMDLVFVEMWIPVVRK
uniref:Uncharacterized protein n=1 Tax=Virgibacillus oceani TaxID=1479511 RepID=A0A917HNH9_9BACI|nr:hypothetical protein GCM10011398_32370 [Virgibacillus oceani]